MLEASFWSDKSAMASRPYGRQPQGTSRGCLRMHGRRSTKPVLRVSRTELRGSSGEAKDASPHTQRFVDTIPRLDWNGSGRRLLAPLNIRCSSTDDSIFRPPTFERYGEVSHQEDPCEVSGALSTAFITLPAAFQRIMVLTAPLTYGPVLRCRTRCGA